jgi:hypothetical protein
LADLVSAKFLIGMTLLIVLISAGGHGVLERGNGSTWVREMYRFDGGNHPFDWGKWCVQVGEIVDLRTMKLYKTEMCCHLMP